MSNKTIHLGFEVGSGRPIAIPLRHLAVTGQTQESGKTTTLEALVARAGVPAIAFVTKRGESSFAEGQRLQPYFRDRADWQFVSSIIDATLQEKNKFLRPWIMKICRSTRSLADVHREVKKALHTAKGINEGVYTQLDAYLELIVPEIGRIPMSKGLQFAAGLNVMDVSGFATPMQMLFVQSAIDWVNHHERGVVTIVPEAWEFIPEGKGSPVKSSAIELVRKGAGIGNFIWVDSQDMAGVDKVVLRGCTVWLIGVQREANEIKRNLSNIPAGIARPKPGDIARLEKGQFYACWRDTTVKLYVQPAWMEASDAIDIAKGRHQVDSFPSPIPPRKEKEDVPMSAAVEQKLDKLLEFLAKGQQAQAAVDQVAPKPSPAIAATMPSDEDALYQRFKRRLVDEVPALLRLLVTTPEMEITIERKTVETDIGTAKGMIALLLKEGFIDKPLKAGEVYKELKRRFNYGGISARAYEQLEIFAKDGFVTKEADGYKAVHGMKVNVINK